MKNLDYLGIEPFIPININGKVHEIYRVLYDLDINSDLINEIINYEGTHTPNLEGQLEKVRKEYFNNVQLRPYEHVIKNIYREMAFRWIRDLNALGLETHY